MVERSASHLERGSRENSQRKDSTRCPSHRSKRMKVMNNNNIFAPFAEGIGYGATVSSTTPLSSRSWSHKGTGLGFAARSRRIPTEHFGRGSTHSGNWARQWISLL